MQTFLLIQKICFTAIEEINKNIPLEENLTNGFRDQMIKSKKHPIYCIKKGAMKVHSRGF